MVINGSFKCIYQFIDREVARDSGKLFQSFMTLRKNDLECLNMLHLDVSRCMV